MAKQNPFHADDLSRRRFFSGMAAAGTVALLAGAPASLEAQEDSGGLGRRRAPVSGPSLDTAPDTNEKRIDDLVTCNHILFDLDLADAMGHPSVRSKNNPNRFYMSQSVATGLVTHEDIMEFDLESNPINPGNRREHGERFIHSEIYRARPDVQAIVHCHTSEVVSFGSGGIPLRPVFHMAGFLLHGAPVFDSRKVTDNGGYTGVLIYSKGLGRGLAESLGKTASVVLMRGHGMTTVGGGVPAATSRAWYTYMNAKILMDLLKMGGEPIYINEEETGRPGVGGSGEDRNWPLWKARANTRSAAYIAEFKRTGKVPTRGSRGL
jgi:ribulose-5-phosphate 4-epimerase/fuculose-1-phosphate aldolase